MEQTRILNNNISYNNNNVIIAISQHIQNPGIFNVEAYSRPKMMRHIENPGTIRTIYSGIFRDITILSHVQVY